MERKGKPISLIPSFKLGRLCGIVIGDGSLFLSKNRNYVVKVGSTIKDGIVQEFMISAKENELNPLFCLEKRKERRIGEYIYPPSICYIAKVNNKQLYNALRPYKLKNFEWKIPEFLTTKDSLMGFVGGLFDAEGSKRKNGTGFYFGCKSKKSLKRLQEVLLYLGFTNIKIKKDKGRIFWRLSISGKENRNLLNSMVRLKNDNI